MTKATTFRGIIVFGVFCLGTLSGLLWSGRISPLTPPLTPHATVMAQSETPDLAAMQADIAHLKEVVPSQSHSMTDVGFQFANLWFAGKNKNWPLADFYLFETRQHIAWTVRIRPVRRNPDGSSVDLRPIFDKMLNGPLKDLNQSIQSKNEGEFVSAYKQTMAACYACHAASAKPFLRPVIPQTPPQPLMSYDPRAR